MKHWNQHQDEHGIAWLNFNMADSETNVLTIEALEEFDHLLIEIAHAHPQGLVIGSTKSNFILGADVKHFATIQTKEEAEQHIARAHDILFRLESLPFPTVAMIKGLCLGGGLELALPCDYRVACNDDQTKMGFPEVHLGIFPGFGGTVRAIKLMGHIPALSQMLSGRLMNSKIAEKLGVIDVCVPERQLKCAARRFIFEQPKKHRPTLTQQAMGLAPLRPLVAKMLKRQVAKRVNPIHYPAPFALIDHWQKTAGHKGLMYQSERINVAKLIMGDSAQNLIRIFMLQNRMKDFAKASDFKAQRVHVIGAGVMGGDIAAWCALKGMRVTLQDREPKYLSNAIKRAHQLFKKRVKNRWLRQATIDRLIPDYQGYGIAQADVIIEAIFENKEAKQAIFKLIEHQAPAHALMATNTSSIPLNEISGVLKQPKRLVGIHFFNPVAKMQLVEVVSDEQTSQAVQDQAAAFTKQIGKLPLPVKSSPGFLVNRILMPYLLEAVNLYEAGVSPTLIDKMAVQFGMPMGPLELADTVGLDICLSVAHELSETLHCDIPTSLQKLVQAGALGKKTALGYYPWEKGKAKKPAIDQQQANTKELVDRMILRMVNEAMACLREGVVADSDLLDAGAIFGTGFAPFRGGPMHYSQQVGLTQLREKLHHLEAAYGTQFHEDEGWYKGILLS